MSYMLMHVNNVTILMLLICFLNCMLLRARPSNERPDFKLLVKVNIVGY